ncbi:MAG: hypothetical protein AABN33_21795 [Acidobacteriota bacterium]
MDRLSRKDLWVLQEWKAGVAIDLLDWTVDNSNRAAVRFSASWLRKTSQACADDSQRAVTSMARDTALGSLISRLEKRPGN